MYGNIACSLIIIKPITLVHWCVKLQHAYSEWTRDTRPDRTCHELNLWTPLSCTSYATSIAFKKLISYGTFKPIIIAYLLQSYDMHVRNTYKQ